MSIRKSQQSQTKMLYLPISVVCVNSDPVETVTISKAAWNTLYIVVYIYLVVSYSFLRNPIVATVQAMRIPYLTPLFIQFILSALHHHGQLILSALYHRGWLIFSALHHRVYFIMVLAAAMFKPRWCGLPLNKVIGDFYLYTFR